MRLKDFRTRSLSYRKVKIQNELSRIRSSERSETSNHTHTHTHIFIHVGKSMHILSALSLSLSFCRLSLSFCQEEKLQQF